MNARNTTQTSRTLAAFTAVAALLTGCAVDLPAPTSRSLRFGEEVLDIGSDGADLVLDENGCTPGFADCDGDQSTPCAPARGGSSSLCPASSCQRILATDPNAADGRYWIDPENAGAFEVLCNMTEQGGGWTFLMKAAPGNAFAYDAGYWTTNNLLNETDLSRDEADAKYDSFNRLPVQDLMAVWPGLDNGAPFYWLEFGIWPPETTALIGFQEPLFLGKPKDSAAFDARFFSAQTAPDCGDENEETERYGIDQNMTSACVGCVSDCTSCGTRVRWGFQFNENDCCDWGSNDANGGIGLTLCDDTGYSAGDWTNGLGGATSGINRRTAVEVWGR